MTSDAMVDTTQVAPARSAGGARALRIAGWVLIIAGAIVGLFIVYLLWWTGVETAAIQDERLAEWQVQLDGLDPDGGLVEDIPVVGPADDVPVPDVGSSVALLWFEREGERIVIDRVLSVQEGVDLPLLSEGPGRYPSTAAPGAAGNFAVAGHRTTALAPFYNLDTLRTGDEIHVVDRAGNHFVYDFELLQVVQPQDRWVLQDDPLDRGSDHWLTLTTCHPRFSAAERLIAFASLRVGDR